MNMSLYELYIWLSKMDFPSLTTIWTWLITVPWWLAIGTTVLVVFAIRITWGMTFYFLNWLFDWTFQAGEWFADKVRVLKRQVTMTLEFGKAVKKKLFR